MDPKILFSISLGLVILLVIFLLIWVNFFYKNNSITLTFYKGESVTIDGSLQTTLYYDKKKLKKAGLLTKSSIGGHTISTIEIGIQNYNFIQPTGVSHPVDTKYSNTLGETEELIQITKK